MKTYINNALAAVALLCFALTMPALHSEPAVTETKEQRDVRMASAPPNILILFADDIGYEALGAYGGLDFKTPNLDRMAAEGVRFTRAHTSPVCTPSRVSLHTSLYTTDHGHTNVLPVHLGTKTQVDFKKMPTFAQLLRKSGYQTSTTGKWQLATLYHYPDHISRAGFDSWCVWQAWDGKEKTSRYWNPYFNQNGKVREDIADRFGPDVLDDYVWERMTAARDAKVPFLILYNMLLPHDPIIATPQDKKLGRTASLGNMIEYLDQRVGLTLQKIQDLGLRDNTYVFFIGDNGTDAKYFRVRHTKAGEVKGGKTDLSDAGSHVPFLVWGPPALPKGTVVDDLVDITDVFPTVCELAKTKIPETVLIRGRSIVPQMQGKEGVLRTWTHQGINKKFSVFDGSWRLSGKGSLIDARNLPAEPPASAELGAEVSSLVARLKLLLDGKADPTGARIEPPR
jgi:arylsulfatase A-like enzyme